MGSAQGDLYLETRSVVGNDRPLVPSVIGMSVLSVTRAATR